MAAGPLLSQAWELPRLGNGGIIYLSTLIPHLPSIYQSQCGMAQCSCLLTCVFSLLFLPVPVKDSHNRNCIEFICESTRFTSQALCVPQALGPSQSGRKESQKALSSGDSLCGRTGTVLTLKGTVQDRDMFHTPIHRGYQQGIMGPSKPRETGLPGEGDEAG